MNSFVPGTHASTFGGNPLSSAVGIAVMRTIADENILENCSRMGKVLKNRLESLKEKYAFIKEVRGKGLIYGMELDFDGGDIVQSALERGLLLNCAAGKVLRFLPPLTITENEIDEMLATLDSLLAEAKR
jgi:acetylornithine/succinyldiaminopimelate/putrescine aminotransferase